MQEIKFHIIPKDLLETYYSQGEDTVEKEFEKLHDSELSIETFSFYTSVAAVFSSKIEEEDIGTGFLHKAQKVRCTFFT